MPFSGGHLLLILLLLGIGLIMFGPKRLPEIGSGMGRAIREFKAGVSEVHGGPADPPSQAHPALTVASQPPAAAPNAPVAQAPASVENHPAV